MKQHILIFTTLICFAGFACSYADDYSKVGSAAKVLVEQAEPISLEACVKLAVDNSYEVRMAKLDLLISESDLMYSEAIYDTVLYGGLNYSEDKRQQLSVFSPDDNQANNYYAGVEKVLPSGTKVSVELSDSRTWNNTVYVSKNPSHSAELTLNFEQPLGKNTFGYIDRRNISLAKIAIENSDLYTKDRIEKLIADVEKAYLDMVFAKEKIEVFRGILEKAKILYETDRKSYDLGTKEKVDLAASESNLATLEAELVIAINSYNKSEALLKLIINMNEKKRIVPDRGFEKTDISMSIEECLKKAFDNRRDYEITKKKVEMKGLELEISDNNKWPELALTATMSNNGIEVDPAKAIGKTTVVDNTEYYAGLELTFPLENRSAESEYLKAKYSKELALIDMKNTERIIIAEVSNAYRDLVSFEHALKYVTKASDLQREKLSEEEKSFKYGRSTTKRMIDYQQDLLRAGLEQNRYLLQFNKAKIELERSMNIVLDKYKELI